MSERGVFAVDRGVWDHPMFASKEPFSRREAWMWLISEAAWKPRRKRIAGKMVDLQRGQVAHSLRFIADAWGWSVNKVRWFIDELRSDTMIDTATDIGSTVITICKYDEYQRVSLPNGTAIDTEADTPTDTGVAQQPHKLEDNKNNKSLSRAKRTRRASENRFDEFWAEYPKREGSNPKQAARTAYNSAVQNGHDEQKIIDGVKGYRAAAKRDQQEGTRFVPHAQTWLRQARWEDYCEAPATFAAPIYGDLPVANWEAKVRAFSQQDSWSRCWVGPGSEPGKFGCLAPPEVQRKYGFEPAQPVPVPDTRPAIGE